MPDAFTIDDVPTLDTDALGTWEEPGDACPYGLTVTIEPDEDGVGEPVWLQCELDGPHDEHEVMLRWNTDDDGTGRESDTG